MGKHGDGKRAKGDRDRKRSKHKSKSSGKGGKRGRDRSRSGDGSGSGSRSRSRDKSRSRDRSKRPSEGRCRSSSRSRSRSRSIEGSRRRGGGRSRSRSRQQRGPAASSRSTSPSCSRRNLGGASTSPSPSAPGRTSSPPHSSPPPSRRTSPSPSSSSPSSSAPSTSSHEHSDRRLYQKLLKYVVRNRVSKLRRALRRGKSAAARVLTRTDAWGQTLLHQACTCGHVEAAQELIKRGASGAAQDSSGNTPAHVAGLKGHLVLLAALLQGGGAGDIDTCVNHQGLSVRAVAERAMAGPGVATTAGGQQTEAGDRQEASAHGEDEWRQRLRDEDSDGEWGGGASSWHSTHPLLEGGQHDIGGAGGLGFGAPAAETDDEWADRLWRQMQERKRRAMQATAGAFFADRGQQLRAEEAARAAAAAAAARQQESDRILREERAKDAQWRRRAMGGAAGPLPPPPGWAGEAEGPVAGGGTEVWDFTELRREYEQKWSALQQRAAAASGGSAVGATAAGSNREGAQAAGSGSGGQVGGGARADEVPWPLPCWLQGRGGLDDTREVLLWGAAGPAEVKRRLREEILRWHPDKFSARYSSLVREGDRAAVMEGVQRVCQHLTQLMGGRG